MIGNNANWRNTKIMEFKITDNAREKLNDLKTKELPIKLAITSYS